MEIKVIPLSHKKKNFTHESELGFGKIFTDRMFLMEWKKELGWHKAVIKPYEPFILDPSSLIFHYGQEIFEGLKAYKWADGSIALFRPEMNAKRFNLSADRLCMPQIPEVFFLQAIEKLVDLEREWIPTNEDCALYIRPTMIAVEPILGVRPSSHFYFYIILSPVGAYYASGFNPVKILVEDTYVRATLGGTGEAKTSGNYATSLKAAMKAKEKGFDQVLWLDSIHKRYIEEVGAMNIFFVYSDRIVTPPLKGTILHGVTRDSILKLIPSLGLKAEEKNLDIEEMMKDVRSGKILEAFGSGTAAVISPVGEFSYKSENAILGQGKVGPISRKLYETLTQIQYGKKEDSFGWIRKIKSDHLASV